MFNEKEAFETEVSSLKKQVAGWREQSYLWRMLSVVQFPATLVAVITTIVLYVTSDIIVHVDPKPSPGYYLTNQIQDKEFVMYAMQFVNLISTFNANNAGKQFEYAAEYLSGPIYGEFRNSYLNKKDPNSKLSEAIKLERTQVYFVDKYFVRIKRTEKENPLDNEVEVRFYGIYTKYLRGSSNPYLNSEAVLSVTLRTQPNNAFNPQGITITKFVVREPKRDTQQSLIEILKMEDREVQKSQRKGSKVKYSFFSY